MFVRTNYVLFSKAGFGYDYRIFFMSHWPLYTEWTVYFFSNFNSCSERSCKEYCMPTLRKDDSCDSTLVIYKNYYLWWAPKLSGRSVKWLELDWCVAGRDCSSLRGDIHLIALTLYPSYRPRGGGKIRSRKGWQINRAGNLLIRSVAHLALIKWATVSNLLRSLKTNERLWAIRSDRSRQMSHCERIAQVAHIKRMTVSESLRSLMINEPISDSQIFFCG